MLRLLFEGFIIISELLHRTEEIIEVLELGGRETLERQYGQHGLF